jgi:CubicO group peptidase (beta-lactamase class C family)
MKNLHWNRNAAILSFVCAFVFLLICPTPRLHGLQQNVAPRQDYAEVTETLSRFIQNEMQDKKLPAFSIALVDDQKVTWAQGFGYADPDKKTVATAETVYRIGSVSKLFTDIGVMQLVERGQLDLEAPVQKYLPDFHPHNPFGTSITLRQLMSHRSGLLREPPIGN